MIRIVKVVVDNENSQEIITFSTIKQLDEQLFKIVDDFQISTYIRTIILSKKLFKKSKKNHQIITIETNINETQLHDNN